MEFTWVIVLVCSLSFVAAQNSGNTAEPTEVSQTSSVSEPTKIVKSEKFLGFSGKWPFTFDPDKARTEIPELKGIISNLGVLWNIITGLIDQIGGSFSGSGKKTPKIDTDDGEY